jgi:hypothetical protein
LEQIWRGGDEVSVGKIPAVEGANLAFAVFDDAPCGIMFPRGGSVECFIHVWLVGFWFALWREKSCGGIIGNDHAPQIAREWKGRE